MEHILVSAPTDSPVPHIPVPRGPVPQVPSAPARRQFDIQIDGKAVTVSEDSTILDAARKLGVETPTLCFLENLTPVNVCRVCVVELEGSRVLVPACSRKVEPGMKIKTDSERVRLSRRLVLEFLASSVDVSTAPEMQTYVKEYGADPKRYGPSAATTSQPPNIDNELYVRDYGKCILCYKCVEACGVDAQNTFAIGIAGRGFSAHIATEFEIPLPDSACVYCGNCIGVCPTGALMFKSEYDMRAAGTWKESEQIATDTICPYCGVGCTLTVHAQNGDIVRVSSPLDHSVTHGHLCIKGRFGWQFVQIREKGIEAANSPVTPTKTRPTTQNP
jgi:predicted molibdopterin-dependent oxidoreductase YjgC